MVLPFERRSQALQFSYFDRHGVPQVMFSASQEIFRVSSACFDYLLRQVFLFRSFSLQTCGHVLYVVFHPRDCHLLP